MRLDVWQRRAIFDLVCWIIVAAVLMCVIGSFIGCATGTSAPDVRNVRTSAKTATAAPPRIVPQLVRLDAHRCVVAADPSAIWYEQAGTTRVMGAAFPCTTAGNAKERWGSGLRVIVVQYEDGTRERIREYWPEYTP